MVIMTFTPPPPPLHHNGKGDVTIFIILPYLQIHTDQFQINPLLEGKLAVALVYLECILKAFQTSEFLSEIKLGLVIQHQVELLVR